jgi:DNA-directed RNA polymerase subunit RPC12/RpoP
MENDKTKPTSDIKDKSVSRYKVLKRPSTDTDNPMAKVLESIVSGLEGSLGKRTYLCGNPDCGTLIIFHTKEPRPIVCHRCGSEIDWEGEYITTIRICPKCNKEYDTTANYCPYHTPPVSLIEKELEKHGSSFL